MADADQDEMDDGSAGLDQGQALAQAPPPQAAPQQAPPPPGVGPGRHLLTGLVGVLLDGLQAGLKTPMGPNAPQQAAATAAAMPAQRQQAQIQLASQQLQLKAQLAQSRVQDLQTKLLTSKLNEQIGSGMTDAGWSFFQQALKNGTAKMVSGEAEDSGAATAKLKELHDADPKSSQNYFVAPGIKKGTWGVWEIFPKNTLENDMEVTIPGDKTLGVEDQAVKIPSGTDMGTAKILMSGYMRDQAAKLHAGLEANKPDKTPNTAEEQAYQQAAQQAQKAGQPAPSRLAFHQQWEKASAKPVSATATDNRLDKSYQYNQTRLDKIRTPIDALAGRFTRLQDALNQNTPQADALIGPELLSVMAGGAGSGLRMNEAEIARIVGGRSKLESLKADINKWQLDPKKALSITPEQRSQIRSLVTEVGKKINSKQAILSQAGDDLVSTDNIKNHRQIVADVQKQLDSVDSGKFPDRETATKVRNATGQTKPQAKGFDWESLPVKQQ